ncbi:hypothetical protein N7536_006639 [Penicillium majusculum]|nr:hypothetical protein N7536_006639 [Penicillium majusculum]
MLTLYEVAVTFMLGSWVESQESNGGGIVIVTKVKVSVGVLQLDSREAAFLTGRVLREATTRLGKMMHDMEEVMGIVGYKANPSEGNDNLEELRQLTPWLQRILGRIEESGVTIPM